ncbi:MAG: hypothetical protein KDC38_07685 [Planctomycetes bacterium]|nr:hypothetical protein [Planctomycetota bacterium]
MTTLHAFLDVDYGPRGDELLRERLARGEDPEARLHGETALHVAVRRRRLGAVAILIENGVDLDAVDRHGKTGYAHAIRRTFGEIAELLDRAGANTRLEPADLLAVFVTHGRLDEARAILAENPSLARTGNPEEDRLLADVAGRPDTAPVELLIAAGADLRARGLDDGTPLHVAAWFGQPGNARLLLDAGAPLDLFDSVHNSSPVGWAVHGSRFSGGASERRQPYIELVQMLIDAGSSLSYPDDPGGRTYLERLHQQAAPWVRGLLPD